MNEQPSSRGHLRWNPRLPLTAALAVATALAGATWVGAQAHPGTYNQMRSTTPAEREAARVRQGNQTKGAKKVFAGVNPLKRHLSPLAPGSGMLRAGGGPALATMGPPNGLPDYFGVGNYANSPLPTVNPGPVRTIAMVNGGGGYAAPVISFTNALGDLSPGGAVAHATVVGGIITGVIVDVGGTYAQAPIVTIADTPPAIGSGAIAFVQSFGTVVGGMRKFVDTFPGLCDVTGANDLGQCIPLATKFSTLPPGVPNDGDYYEIGLNDYNMQFHKDLPGPYNAVPTPLSTATRVRGYKDLNPTAAFPGNHYLGPLIVAKKDRPVRVKFTNNLPPSGTPGSNLFIPVDTSYMGAGTGPDGSAFTQNRATLHLHGGNTPWISDGTTHQWITPVGETATLKEGQSKRNVPDMPDPGLGSSTFYWTNQQGGRLMFYHDHAHGITRLNVYAGEAAGYLLLDPVEQDALAAATVPGTLGALVGGTSLDLTHIIPLVIQDKSFVPSDGSDGSQLAVQDPTWDLANYGSTGNFWFPHVYTPNQNPADHIGGANAYGRWDYGPWFWPPQDPAGYVGQPFPCPTVAAPDQVCPGTPMPSGTPESFMDTPLINGTAYPSLQLNRAAYRFEALSAANDRAWSLQLYYAIDKNGVVCKPPNTFDAASCTEVKMVGAVPHTANSVPPLCATETLADANGLVQADLDLSDNPINGTGLPANCWPTTWPTDNRAGGVPDPLTAGPPTIELGSEGGLMPAPAVIPSMPTNYNYNRRDIVVLNVSTHGLWLGPAERANFVVDFSGVPDGSVLILYNDSPAPVPALDPRIDYYTGDPDQTDSGGAPSTQPGYGPNTRTLMQIKVNTGAGDSSAFSLHSLKLAQGGIYTSTQPAPIVPQTAYGAATDTYATIFANYISYFNGALTGVELAPGGAGYTGPPLVQFIGGGGINAAATPLVSGGQVIGLTITNRGSGYATPPDVLISGGGGAGATAVATVKAGKIDTLVLTPSQGSGYTVPPDVLITGGGATLDAQATANISGGKVVSFNLTNPGAGYTSAPTVTLSGGGGGVGAAARAVGTVKPLESKAIHELFTTDYGRMNALLGLEMPFTNWFIQTTIPYSYIDPPTEILQDGQVQFWKITHNGVDTHWIHFHLVNVQVINRVGWDGAIRGPDANEQGWKDTVRMNPLEDVIVAMLPVQQSLPWPLADSFRYMDTTAAPNTSGQFTGIDPQNNPVAVSNTLTNFGQEYVWHCHILGHEENDMMRALVFQVPPAAPLGLSASRAHPGVLVTFTDKSASESSFTLQRATDALFTTDLQEYTVGASVPPESWNGGMGYFDASALDTTAYYYRVRAVDDNFKPPFTQPWNATPALLGAWSATFLLTSPPLISTTSPLPAGVVGVAYSQTFTATGGNGALSWTVTAGALPGGLNLSTGGLLSGTPTAAGTFNFTVTVTDSSAQSDSRAFSLTIAPILITSTSPLPSGTVGTAYSFTFQRLGGVTPVTWTKSGALPTGMTFTTAGVLSGTPNNSGTFNFTVTVTDSALPTHNTATKPFTLVITPKLAISTTSPLAWATVGTAATRTINGTGGTKPYVFSLLSGSLPTGMGLTTNASNQGVISGTPTAAASFSFTLQLADSATPTGLATKAYTMLVITPLVMTTGSPLPAGNTGVAYSQTLNATGGTLPYTWSRQSGTLPPGIGISAGGVLSGTPTTPGQYTFVIRVRDSSTPTPGATVTKTFGLRIN